MPAARTVAAPATARIRTVALVGLEPAPVDVEVMVTPGLPAFSIVGLPDKAVGESRERVRAALASLSLALPLKRITVNLAPGDLAKEGSHFDLPIALGLLVVMGVLPGDAAPDAVVLGELGLDGALRPVPGVLAAALAAAEQDLSLVCPAACGHEAAWLGETVEIVAAPNLLALIGHLRGEHVLPPPVLAEAEDERPWPDLADVKGQETAKRALEVAAAGGHNLLMQGPPGSGKSMLAHRMAGLLPPLSPAETLEVGLVHSVGGRLQAGRLSRRRPFRSPHHASSTAAMVGGGVHARPGEISLAHRGMLFLDELPEFPRPVLEALRQPLEAGTVTVARANHHITYPARLQLVAAMNPCRCGYLDDPALACAKAPRCAGDYQKRLSGPLLDRIDIHIDVPALTPRELALPAPAERGAAVAERVAAVRALQAERLAAEGHPELRLNAEMEGELLDRLAPLDGAAQELLTRATERLRLSARGYHRILRVARTIADLDGAPAIKKAHLAEAIAYRRRPPSY
ncbi:MAG: YifB family Mg chelatase-like AAA ATPase [Geminicoccaceae bacterium]|nr:YifB family Mg chelatase-like AAA ATPase [Geminicoccaceae bacterium]